MVLESGSNMGLLEIQAMHKRVRSQQLELYNTQCHDLAVR